MGVVLDPNTYKHTALWGVVLGTGVGLSSQKPALLKLLALGLTVSSLVPFSDHKFVRFTVGMATVMRFLRVCEVLMDPQYFEQRGAMYTLKFAFLYVSALLLCGGETGTDDARTA
ncbi:hypothetical protein BASA81_003437 [Batrachochytrium salamandrivorans]|nr:hypothetical protein BASA81_003437 [Batrachochytrium salamandrivorans]